MYKSEFVREKIGIESFGGNGGLVTGSCHKIQIRDSQIVVDVGMFQGLEERNSRGVQMNLNLKDNFFRGVSSIAVTHAHVDHIGRLPVVFKKGFRPDIFATEATAALVELMLLNSAEIQEQQPVEKRLYSRNDVDLTLRCLKSVEPFKEFRIGQRHSNITAEFLPNGHILGSASVLVRDRKSPGHLKDIFFSGDIGKPIQSLSGGYSDFFSKYPKDPIHAMVLESTNFEKAPVTFKEKEESLMTYIEKIWSGGGNVLLPVLSLHRSQEIMEMLHNFQKEGKIPDECSIFIDAPLAMKLTEVYREFGPECFLPRYGNNDEFYKTEQESLARFDLKNLTVISSHEASVVNDFNMANYQGKAIIVASGGMFGFGRVMNYKNGNFCRNPKNGVIFTCFQVDGTDGSRILYSEINKEAKKDKTSHDKKGRLIGAQVFKAEGFTSHASGEELFDFISRFNLNELRLVDIGHGRNSSRQKMAEEFKLRGYVADVITPNIGEKVELYA